MRPEQRVILERAYVDTIKPMKGQLGPWKQSGLMTGGGLLHGPLAMHLRGYNGVEEIMDDVLKMDNRYVNGATYVTTRHAITLNGPDSNLDWHRDNDLIKGCPDVCRIQNQVVVYPPLGPNGTVGQNRKRLRTGCLASRVPLTKTIQRNVLCVFCTRGSMSECGGLGKQTNDRPKPGAVLGGYYCKLAETKGMSLHDMISFCKEHVQVSVYADVDLDGLPSDCRGWGEFVRMCEAIVGPVINTIDLFKERMVHDTARSAVLAALLGTITAKELRSTRLVSNVELCVQVYEEACKTMDPGILRCFVNSSMGKKRQSSAASQKRRVKAKE